MRATVPSRLKPMTRRYRPTDPRFERLNNKSTHYANGKRLKTRRKSREQSLFSIEASSISLILSQLGPGSPIPNIATPSHHSLHRSRRCNRRPNIEIENRFTCWFWVAGVVIDHISNLFLLTIVVPLHKPIVAIKRRFCAM